jgi:hypothetical protein
MSLHWPQIQRTQCLIPSTLSRKAHRPVIETTSTPNQSKVRMPFSEKLSLPAGPSGPAER